MFSAQIQMARGPQQTHLAFCRTAFTTPPSRLPTDRGQGVTLKRRTGPDPSPHSCLMKPLQGRGTVWGDAGHWPQPPNSLQPPGCLGEWADTSWHQADAGGAGGCHQCSWSHSVTHPWPLDLTNVPRAARWLWLRADLDRRVEGTLPAAEEEGEGQKRRKGDQREVHWAANFSPPPFPFP